MARNVEILLMKLDREQGKDPRTLYYLAKAYYDEGHLIKQGEEKLKSYKKAEDLIKKYLTMSGWAEERGQAIEYLVEIYRETGRFDEAIRASMTAIEMFPQYPSLYAGLAMTYLLQKQYDKAWFWVEWAEKVPMPATTLVITGRDLQLRMLEIYFQLGLETNHLDKSYMAIGKMIKMFPDSEVMQRRLKELTKIKKEGELVKYYCRIGKYLDEKKKTDNLLSLISSIPFEIMDNPYIQEMKKDLLPSREWGKKEIAIFCGAAYEEWDETSVKGGIGGSEEAVIYASRELSKLGYKVTVYNTTPKKHTDEYGVNWERYTSFNPKDKFNYLIIWRNVFIFDNEFNAKKKILWLHDIPNQLDYTEKRLKNIDKILVLSKYHRAFLPSVPDDKVYVTANGIIDEHPKMKRQNNLMVYGSSYDRGLEHLLDMWGDIKKNVPDAELHIFYGWNTFDVMFQNNPERKEWKKRMENKMRQEGIKHLGRINHAKVAQEMALADVWAYPTHFEEISCLTAMKAQTYGAIPCYIDLAALKETCQHGIRIEGDIYDNETKEIYKQRLITLLQDGKGKEIIRKQMIGSVNFEWGRVIKGWKNDILY
jgi:glycosyltransferase involved in cell wall biosynthesis